MIQPNNLLAFSSRSDFRVDNDDFSFARRFNWIRSIPRQSACYTSALNSSRWGWGLENCAAAWIRISGTSTLTLYVPNVVSSLFGAKRQIFVIDSGNWIRGPYANNRDSYGRGETGMNCAGGTLFGSFLVEPPEEAPAVFFFFSWHASLLLGKFFTFPPSLQLFSSNSRSCAWQESLVRCSTC